MNYTQEELAQKLGLQKSAIAKYENGRVENIKRSIIAQMAEILECSPAYLMGWDRNVGPLSNGTKHKTAGVTINVLGRVAAGIPIEAIEDVIDTEEITEEMAATGDFFGLQIHGDSMEPRICEGDVVIAVSYTHLDVYKRQTFAILASLISQSKVALQFRLFFPFRKSLLSAVSNSRRKSFTVYPVLSRCV